MEPINRVGRYEAASHYGKFAVKTWSKGTAHITQFCANMCGTLNCIIFYNAMILSNVLQYQTEQGNSIAAADLERISPVAWQHINFHGRYEFTKAVQPIDIEMIVQELIKDTPSAEHPIG